MSERIGSPEDLSSRRTSPGSELGRIRVKARPSHAFSKEEVVLIVRKRSSQSGAWELEKAAGYARTAKKSVLFVGSRCMGRRKMGRSAYHSRSKWKT